MGCTRSVVLAFCEALNADGDFLNLLCMARSPPATCSIAAQPCKAAMQLSLSLGRAKGCLCSSKFRFFGELHG